MVPVPRRVLVAGALFVLAALPALGCEYPDEGNMPLRRAVAAVKLLPEVEAWAAAMAKSGAAVQYAVLLDSPKRRAGGCYWPVEVRADGRLWRRYYVTPGGERLAEPK